MPNFTHPLPLSLYIHIPWCVRKCPYCDFNSHEKKANLPEEAYTHALLQELDSRLFLIQERPIHSIFFGGGTPSLFSGRAIQAILQGIASRLPLSSDIEITLEANPGTIDQARFIDFREAGINRLSLGIQSLQNEKLQALGRIHDKDQALLAVTAAKNAGFSRMNLDFMYGLPNQSVNEALDEINMALSLGPSHFSWYQLTIEPNTVFYRRPPHLPDSETLWEMQQAGQALLQAKGMQQYEVSAYCLPQQECRHNLNYWQYGDYLGLGAGSHSKITNIHTANVVRFHQVKQPKDYLDAAKRSRLVMQTITDQELIFEFMLNALRLSNGFPLALFTERTGLEAEIAAPILKKAAELKLIDLNADRVCPSALGKKFLDNLTELFLPA